MKQVKEDILRTVDAHVLSSKMASTSCSREWSTLKRFKFSLENYNDIIKLAAIFENGGGVKHFNYFYEQNVLRKVHHSI